MKIRRILTTTVLTLAFIIISATTAAALSCSDCDICVNQSGWWRDGGTLNASTTPIQAAVGNATAGETICVAAGNYTDNVDIATVHLTLRGEGAGLVTVTAKSPSDHVFEVTADYVNISGFTATGATANWADAGFYLNGVDHCNISENDAPNNNCSIVLLSSSNNTLVNNNASNNPHLGIHLWNSRNNTLTSNTASNNYQGIYLGSSSNNTLTSNTANSNSHRGICLARSSNNTLTGNTADSNIFLGIGMYGSSSNTLTSNTANSSGYYGILLGSSSSNTLTSNTVSNNRWGICLGSSSNNTLASNTASNNVCGIYLSNSSNNTLTSNTASLNNGNGIQLLNSSNNTLKSNNASNNHCGIGMCSSSSNLIYNNYFNNTNNALDNGNNQWNITRTSGTSIIGGSYLGGNYWSDYAGNDTDGDGLGDTLLPYNSSVGIHNGGDFHPLVVPTDTTPPVIIITTPEPYGLYIVGSMTLNYSATDDESGVATIEGNLTNTSGVSQNVIGDNSFGPEVGVYTLVVTATDNAGNTNISDPVFFVVYDPDGGHATGGGWFYPDDESTLPDGKANFGFTARYKNDVSTGKLSFQYKDADLHLKSTSIDWLTISAVSAQFQGTGTINGEGLYTFRVKAKDNGEPGVDVDHFDIKIWNGTDTEADPYHKAKNTISGGNIQVHTK